MKHLRLYTILTIFAFSDAALLGETVVPPVVTESPSPVIAEKKSEEIQEEELEVKQEQLAANKVDEKAGEDLDASEQDARTDMFMRGAFTILSALLFFAGYFGVKTHQGKRV